MNFTLNQQGSGDVSGFQFLWIATAAWSLLITLFWMFVAWRAMRAHEKLARAQMDSTHAQFEMLNALRLIVKQQSQSQKPGNQ